MTEQTDKAADEAMREIWKQWFQFYQDHFRANGMAISMADQMAFYEIAQPILRQIAEPRSQGTEPIGDASGSYMGTGSAYWNPNLSGR